MPALAPILWCRGKGLFLLEQAKQHGRQTRPKALVKEDELDDFVESSIWPYPYSI